MKKKSKKLMLLKTTILSATMLSLSLLFVVTTDSTISATNRSSFITKGSITGIVPFSYKAKDTIEIE